MFTIPLFTMARVFHRRTNKPSTIQKTKKLWKMRTRQISRKEKSKHVIISISLQKLHGKWKYMCTTHKEAN